MSETSGLDERGRAAHGPLDARAAVADVWDISDPMTQVSFDVLWKEFLRLVVNAETTLSAVGRATRWKSRTAPKLMCCQGVMSPCCGSDRWPEPARI